MFMRWPLKQGSPHVDIDLKWACLISLLTLYLNGSFITLLDGSKTTSF
jgi:hypothetical protein